MLVPGLARPVSRMAEGHIGSWDPVFFGLLVINSAFTASAAYWIVAVARRLRCAESVALFSGAYGSCRFVARSAR